MNWVFSSAKDQMLTILCTWSKPFFFFSDFWFTVVLVYFSPEFVNVTFVPYCVCARRIIGVYSWIAAYKKERSCGSHNTPRPNKLCWVSLDFGGVVHDAKVQEKGNLSRRLGFLETPLCRKTKAKQKWCAMLKTSKVPFTKSQHSLTHSVDRKRSSTMQHDRVELLSKHLSQLATIFLCKSTVVDKSGKRDRCVIQID